MWFHGLAGALRPSTFKDLLVSSQNSTLVLAHQPQAPKDHQNFQHVDQQLKVGSSKLHACSLILVFE